MTGLVFNTVGHGFGTLPQYGPDSFLARLTHDHARQAGFPLFTPESAQHVSRSPFMCYEATFSRINRMNPGLPPLAGEERFVVAGQQPGLLTGPLYTFLKAVSAVALAGKLSRERGVPAVPLFWVASEDHDVLEVNRVSLCGHRFVHPYKGEIRRGKVPQVGEISIADAREPLLAFMGEHLPETEFKPWVLEGVGASDFSSYSRFFSSLLGFVFADFPLRIVDPLLIRPLTAPVLAALVERWPEIRAAFDGGAALLRDQGIEPPLKSLGIYEIVEGLRVPAEFLESGVRLHDGEHSFPDAADLIRSRPEGFSPGAGLRPILQDAVLPVAATIAGPTELLYLWQVRPLNALVKVIPSLLLPRISATFVEEKIRKAAEKAGLEREGLFRAGKALEELGREEGPDPEIAGIEEKARALMEAVGRACGEGAAKMLQRSRDALAAQVEKIVRRLREERTAASGLDRSRLEKVADALLPGGKPQERAVNLFQFLNLYGPDFVQLAVEGLDPFLLEHQAVFMERSKDKEE